MQLKSLLLTTMLILSSTVFIFSKSEKVLLSGQSSCKFYNGTSDDIEIESQYGTCTNCGKCKDLGVITLASGQYSIPRTQLQGHVCYRLKKVGGDCWSEWKKTKEMSDDDLTIEVSNDDLKIDCSTNGE